MPRTSIRPEDILREEDSYTTLILVSAVDRLGLENVVNRDPEGLVLDLQETVGFELPQLVKDKLIAAATLLDTDLFYSSPDSFNTLSQILSGEDFKSAMVDLATFPQMAWAINEAYLIDPSDDGFSTTVVDFILARMIENGFLVLPRSIRRRLKDYDYKDREIRDPIEYMMNDLDPKTYFNILEIHKDRADEVDSLVYGNLSEILEVLMNLKLDNADPEYPKRLAELVEKLKKETE